MSNFRYCEKINIIRSYNKIIWTNNIQEWSYLLNHEKNKEFEMNLIKSPNINQSLHNWSRLFLFVPQVSF